MNIGWIDFSDSDRRKTMDVLRLFQEQGAMDELGIGVIRDAFANYFFPGTSTIQTRAKYFFIVPYAMMDIVSDPRVTSVQEALRRLDDIEKESAELLKKAGGDSGIIGATILPKWVVRPPSTIYWSGLRTLGLFNGGLIQNMTIPEYFRVALKLRDDKKASSLGNRRVDAAENEKDDADAGDFVFRSFWKIPYKLGWKNDLSVALTSEEADFLSMKIKTSNPESLFAFVLREKDKVDVGQFEEYATFSSFVYPLLVEAGDENNADMLKLADGFSDFIALAQIRYNLILSGGENLKARSRWHEEKDRALEYATHVDLDAVFSRLHLHNPGLRDFLFSFRNAVLNNSDWDAADDAIIKQESRIKGIHAKLKNKNKYPIDKWVGGFRLDYRFTDARRLIMDIRGGGNNV